MFFFFVSDSSGVLIFIMATSCMEPPFKKLKKICVEKEIQQHNSEQQPPNISDEHISFGKDENNGKKVKEMFSEDFQAHPCYSSFSGCCIRKGHSTKVLINIQCQEKLVMEGIYFIKPLIGFANILGYNIPTGERQPIFSPRHRSLLSVTCGKLTAPAFDVDDHVYTCGCVVYTPEILSDLKKIYALSGSEMSSLHFSQVSYLALATYIKGRQMKIQDPNFLSIKLFFTLSFGFQSNIYTLFGPNFSVGKLLIFPINSKL